MQERPTRKKRVYIRASEIGAYVYCRRAWWLQQVAGFAPEGKEQTFAQGEAAHLQHGQKVRRAQRQYQAALWLCCVGLLILVVALFLLFHG